MVIFIDTYGCALGDRGNLDRLKAVLYEGGEPERAGTIDDEKAHVFVAPEDLRSWAGVAAEDPEWSRRFDEMVDAAGRHGWIDADGRIQVHIETA